MYGRVRTFWDGFFGGPMRLPEMDMDSIRKRCEARHAQLGQTASTLSQWEKILCLQRRITANRQGLENKFDAKDFAEDLSMSDLSIRLFGKELLTWDSLSYEQAEKIIDRLHEKLRTEKVKK